MAKYVSVVAVIVTYNRKSLLTKCIESLLKQDSVGSLDIYIIDNASTDGTQDALQLYKDNKSIRYFNTGENLGGAGGFEFGVRQAEKGNFDYIWIMDDDTIPNSTALKELLKEAERHETFGFLSSHVLWIDGTTCTMNVQRKDIFRKVDLKDFKKKVIPVEYATFVSLLIPMSRVKELGAPIGDFFIWGDDWEYTRRISKKYSSYVVTDSKVIHMTATNIGCDISNDIPERIDRYRYYFRNGAYVSKKEGFKGSIYRLLNLLKNITKVIFLSKSSKKERLITIFNGVKEGRSFNPFI